MNAATETIAKGAILVENGTAIDAERIPMLSFEEFAAECEERCRTLGRLAALTAWPLGPTGRALVAVMVQANEKRLAVLGTPITADTFPTLTKRLPQAHAFERELFETAGVRPAGHPWLKPLRRHPRLEPGESHPHPFFTVEGPGIHEVAVGPVHAGIIEPGHFRFQCAGEEVLHLEIHLGYQHRGVEARLLKASPAARLILAESIAGDSAVAHAWAHCMVMEALAGTCVSRRDEAVRAVALELERVSNHVGDLGALSGDVGYLPAASYLGRLRGDALNMLMLMSGNRFGRGLLAPGGLRFELREPTRRRLVDEITRVQGELEGPLDLLFKSSSVLARFERTGILERRTAEELGAVGPTARASGLDRDARKDLPPAVYREHPVATAVLSEGDVWARAMVRRLEIERSLAFAKELLTALPADSKREQPLGRPAPSRFAVGVVEGWRGETVHLALSDGNGALAAYKVVDPSFHNWFTLAMALRGNQISDFPLCNKSFNLSYAGHDL